MGLSLVESNWVLNLPAKIFEIIEDVLPVAVINLIADHYVENDGFTLNVRYYFQQDPVVKALVDRVLEAIGGIKNRNGRFQFEYKFKEIVDQVVISGRIPNQKSFQYYPTPDAIAKYATSLADIGPNDDCLEPSAGQGGLAKHMPKERTVCVELSGLHADILKTQDYRVIQDDFVLWAEKTSQRFNKIIMNPPYSQNRAKLHVEKAMSLLKYEGVLVAILPASFKGKEIISGFEHDYSDIYENEFKDASINTVIVKISKAMESTMAA